uniref:Putative secreted protein n=1 Tax=Ixodes ricinus TaxID=34613 RepID=A0A6B0U6U5_IXORI
MLLSNVPFTFSFLPVTGLLYRSYCSEMQRAPVTYFRCVKRVHHSINFPRSSYMAPCSPKPCVSSSPRIEPIAPKLMGGGISSRKNGNCR